MATEVWIVIGLVAVIALLAVLALRGFQRYRLTESWRHGEFRAVTLGFLIWFGGIFGHRLPPPPHTNVTFSAGRDPRRDVPPGPEGPS
jgi:hypothetical protein